MDTNWMKKWHGVLISILIGFALGMIFSQKCLQPDFLHPWDKRGFSHRDRGGKAMEDRMLEHMSETLHLSTEQKRQVAAIFEAKQPQMKALHEEMRPKFEALRNATRAEIKKILMPEQQMKADAIEAEMEKHKGEHEGPPPEP